MTESGKNQEKSEPEQIQLIELEKKEEDTDKIEENIRNLLQELTAREEDINNLPEWASSAWGFYKEEALLDKERGWYAQFLKTTTRISAKHREEMLRFKLHRVEAHLQSIKTVLEKYNEDHKYEKKGKL
ncbi:MAG: hypothetical protein KGJ89_02155 [Patescibacteria group bacterium]|nr:hypothetical protein [Patescibacteria group bacterium]MDE2015680.1 hypothetical protein [Patescibacteria group bacterium]MDE2226737.1 hypothetical protein [Patescibacteria group bacterium]